MKSENKVWFMHENHYFTKIGHLPVDTAISIVSGFLEDELGFIGYKDGGESKSYQFNRNDEWEEQVRNILETHGTYSPPDPMRLMRSAWIPY